MNTNQSLLKVGGVEATVLHKPVKNLHLNVLPPIGKVRITAPTTMKDDAIRIFMATKITWIKRMQSRFQGQDRQTIREYVSGESHYLFGNKCRLEVCRTNEKPSAQLEGKKKIKLFLPARCSFARRERVMQEWYRAQFKDYLNARIPKWQQKIGVTPSCWGVRRMKTRWGSCNHRKGNIWLNLELVKKPVSCIDYVIVHELIHLIEEKHTERFFELLMKYYPKWKSEKEELNRFILSHEIWES